MINLDSSTPLSTLGLDDAHIAQAVQITLDHQQADSDSDLSIVFSDDAHLQALNHQFMGIDAPTDVLSFPAELIDPDSGKTYLGDIIISVERANAQANAQGHSAAAEILLLIVHGTLHLLGHDHADAEEKRQMWSAQAAIIDQIAARIGLRPALPPE